MVKKLVGWVVIGILAVVVLGLVYIFLTKGYSNGGISIAPVIQNGTSGTPSKTQETGSITSDKISLIVTSPKDGSTLNSTNVTVTGKTTPNAEVFVNDQSGKADANGNFSISIGLDEGINRLVVSANDTDGNVAEQDLSVVVSSFE